MTSTSQPFEVTLTVQLKWLGSNQDIGIITLYVRPTTQVTGLLQARFLQLQVPTLAPALASSPYFICIYDAKGTALTLHPRYYAYTCNVDGRFVEHPSRAEALATLDRKWDALFQHALDRQASKQTGASECLVVWRVTLDKVERNKYFEHDDVND